MASAHPGGDRDRANGRGIDANIQDVLGHESDKMARHYVGPARKFATAELMTKYSLAA
jgi:integrase